MSYVKRANFRPVAARKVMSHSFETQADGSLLEVVKDMTLAENQAELPTREELSVENLMRSGLPMEQIPCGNLLNPTDPANMRELVESVANNLPEFQIVEENEN